jgi:hypothetical protein
MILIITETDISGAVKGNSTSYSVPIYTGEFEGKFASDPNTLIEFPEIFEGLEYELKDIDLKDLQKIEENE